MTVKLIAKTVPVGIDCTPEEFVAYVARVSNPANQANHDTGARLVAYLRKHQHWSPFEMASATLEIVTTRDIGRQILRHRSFAFQEFSQRYAAATEFAEPREARLQDASNRQNSIVSDDKDLQVEWDHMQNLVISQAQGAYSAALAAGIAKEVARSVLPEGLTMTRMYMAGSLRSWVHYVDLRTTPGTQKEHRLIAEACRVELATHFPGIFTPAVP